MTTSATTTDATATDEATASRVTRNGEVPCRWCGIATAEPADGLCWELPVVSPDESAEMQRARTPAKFSECGACEDRKQAATAIAETMPDAVVRELADQAERPGRFPVPPVRAAARQVRDVLRCLAVLGREPADVAPGFWAAAHARLLRHGRGYPAPLLATSWMDRPGLTHVNKHHAAVSPWSWIGGDVRERMAAAFAEAEAEGELAGAPPVKVPPPRGAGRCCGWCGVTHVERDAVAVQRVGGVAQASALAWSRRRPPVRVLCASCVDVVAPEALESLEPATVAALAAAGILDDASVYDPQSLPRLRPFCQAAGAAAGSEPWAHVGGVQGIAEAFRDALDAPPEEAPSREELAERLGRLEQTIANLTDDANRGGCTCSR